MTMTHRTIAASIAAVFVQLLAIPTALAAPPQGSLDPEYAPAEPVVSSAPTGNGSESPATLFSTSKHSLGGFGALETAYTRIAGHDVALGCLEGAFYFDHRLSLGASGCAVMNNVDGTQYGNVVHEPGDKLEVAYGGLAVRYHLLSRELVQLSIGGMVGGGTVGIVNRDEHFHHDDDYRHVKRTDAFFAFEPRLTGYLNLTRWARVGAFAGYRLVSGIDTANLSSGDIGGPTLGGTLQFGWF